MTAYPHHSVGLGGDGDDIAAILDVEEEFGVRLDYADAENWSTAGDVYAAVRRALPPEEADEPDVWDRFAKALSKETGVTASTLSPQSELLAEGGLWVAVANGSARLWVTIVSAAIISIGWLLMR